MESIRIKSITNLALEKLAVQLDELLGLCNPSNQHDSVRMLFTPSRLLIVCGFEVEDSFAAEQGFAFKCWVRVYSHRRPGRKFHLPCCAVGLAFEEV